MRDLEILASVDGDVEFDIQKTILKKKEKRTGRYYIEYDKLTNNVIKVSPNFLQASDIRKDVFVKDEDDLIANIFYRKVPLHKLRVKYNKKLNKKILYLHAWERRNEFDYVLNSRNNSNHFIHVYCDLISKKISANFISDNFKELYTEDVISEQNLSTTPKNLDIYCLNVHERSRLYDKLSLNLSSLFLDHELTFNCHWLPHTADLFQNFGFLHYNYDFNISVSTEPVLIPIKTVDYKPAILYKQENDEVTIQSAIHDKNNFKLGDKILFYIFSYYDPTLILDTLELDSTMLNNYNQFKHRLNCNKEIKMLSNYSHLHVEKINDNSHYKF